MKLKHPGQNKFFLGVSVCLVLNCFSLRADDSPAQAAARAALEQEFKHLDNSQATFPPAPIKPNVAVEHAETPATNQIETPPAVVPVTWDQMPPSAVSKILSTPVPTPPIVISEPLAPPEMTNTVSEPEIHQVNSTPTIATNLAKVSKPIAYSASPPPVLPPPRLINLSHSTARAKPAQEIVTLYGTTYKNARVEKIDGDGILVSYDPAGGGVAMAKIFFEDLTPEVRERYKK